MQAFKRLFSESKFLKITIILCFTESGANLYYRATNYVIDQVGYEYGVNAIACGIIEAIGLATISTAMPTPDIFIEKINRKKVIIGSYIIMCLLGFVFLI
jgi:hypothetical protein